ncbi:MAG: universal stress protein [Xanthobacteraceae bacterium]
MALKDILVQLTSYPESTLVSAVAQAVDFVKAVDAHISALTFEIVVRVPGVALAPARINVESQLAAEHDRSVANARELIDAFEGAATAAGLAHDHFVERCENSQVADIATEYARLHDLTLIPLGPDGSFAQSIAEAIVFGSGRPVIVLPTPAKRRHAGACDTIGVAWDFSRTAARAVADALPLLKQAKTVRIVTVTDDKPIESRHSATALAHHLSYHGVNAISDSQSAAGRPVGQVLEHYARARELDLLVMGAYGHSRMRELILGGATQSILADPPLPVLMAH